MNKSILLLLAAAVFRLDAGDFTPAYVKENHIVDLPHRKLILSRSIYAGRATLNESYISKVLEAARKLAVCEVDLSDTKLLEVPEELKDLECMRILNLSNTDLSNASRAIKMIDQLGTLILSGNSGLRLTDEDLIYIREYCAAKKMKSVLNNSTNSPLYCSFAHCNLTENQKDILADLQKNYKGWLTLLF